MHPVIGTVHGALLTKIALAMMSQQLAEGEHGSNWPPYEAQKRLLRDCEGVFKTKNPA